MPFRATAGGILSSISSVFGNKASAQVETTSISQETSQSMSLLEAKTPSSNLLDKKDDSADTLLNVEQNALVATPLLALGGKANGDKGGGFSESISVYVVREGDTLSQIAEMFGVSQNTILWANDMKKGSVIKEGDILFVLPVSGVEHIVKKGETLKKIASHYKADADEILRYNDIEDISKLAIGDKLIIPNASKEGENDKPVKNLAQSIAKDKKYYEANPIKKLTGYFINPVPGYRKSQGIHGKNSIDMAISTGTPIRASASGKVLLARYGYNGGYGNVVIIKHPNGTETLYAHQSKLNTTTGAQVSQRDIIGYVGSTGRSTGPHLHFEVHGAQNPGVDGSWAN